MASGIFLFQFIPHLLAAVGCLVMALVVWRHASEGVGWRRLLLALLIAGFWMALGAMGAVAPDSLHRLFYRLQFPLAFILPVAWFLYLLVYTRRHLRLWPPLWPLLILVPALGGLLALTGDPLGLVWRPGAAVEAGTFGPFTWLVILHDLWLTLIGIYLLLKARRLSLPIYRQQVNALLLATLLPWLGLLLEGNFWQLFPGFSPIAYAMLLSLAVGAWNLYGLRLVDMGPVARETLVEELFDPVLVLDDGGRIVDANRAGQSLLGGEKLIGRPLVEAAPALAATLEREALEYVHEDRSYQSHLAQLHDRMGRRVGRALTLHDITQLKQANDALQKIRDNLEERVEERTAALRASEAKYRRLAESLPEMIYRLDGQGQPRYVNPAVESFFGYTAEEWLAHPTLWQQCLHEEDRERVLATIEEMREQNMPAVLSYRIRRRDGALRFIEDHVSWERDEQNQVTAINGIMIDVSKRRRRALRLEMMQEIDRNMVRARSLADTARAALKPMHHLIPANWATVIGVDAETGEGQVLATSGIGGPPPGQVFPLDGLAADYHLQRAPFLIDNPFGIPWGEGMRAAIAAPLYVGGELLGFMQLVSDSPVLDESHLDVVEEVAGSLAVAMGQARLHEQASRHAQALEEEVERRTHELREANRRLQELDRLRSQLIDDISHELRTPLTSLALYLDLLPKADGDRRENYVRILREQQVRLAELVDGVVVLAQLDLMRGQGVFEPVDVNDLIQDAVTRYRSLASTNGVALTVSGDRLLPPIRGNRSNLRRALEELLDNALHYTSEGEIRVQAYTATRADEEQVVIEVIDSGMGIRPEDQPYIFDRFFRGQGIGQLSHPGVGIGLTIAQQIVTLHEGWIELESKLGEGSCFRVYLPATAESAGSGPTI